MGRQPVSNAIRIKLCLDALECDRILLFRSSGGLLSRWSLDLFLSRLCSFSFLSLLDGCGGHATPGSADRVSELSYEPEPGVGLRVRLNIWHGSR